MFIELNEKLFYDFVVFFKEQLLNMKKSTNELIELKRIFLVKWQNDDDSNNVYLKELSKNYYESK